MHLYFWFSTASAGWSRERALLRRERQIDRGRTVPGVDVAYLDATRRRLDTRAEAREVAIIGQGRSHDVTRKINIDFQGGLNRGAQGAPAEGGFVTARQRRVGDGRSYFADRNA